MGSTAEITKAVAEYIVESTDPPAELRELAVRTLVDTVGVLIAAREEEAVELQRSVARTGGDGTVSVLYDGSKTDMVTAALLNGTAAHALDYDLSGLVRGHTGAIIWPAALAVAEQVGASGRDLVDAALVGFEVCAAVADGLDIPDHHARWHSTSTLGIFGAVAAAARLLGLDVEQTRYALGIVGSMSAGSKQNFGTMTKPLHAGMAASNAVYAAQLASIGFTASEDQLEGAAGFYAAYSNKANPERVLETLAKKWTLADRGFSGLRMKLYPCCYSSHRAIKAAIQLHESGLDPASIERIEVTMAPGSLDAIVHHRPKTGEEAKFSGEYVIAAALLDGAVRLESFDEATLERDDIRRLIDRTTLSEAEHPPVGDPTFVGKFFATLQVKTATGEEIGRADVLDGEEFLTTTREAIEAKFRDCVEFSQTGWSASDLLDELWGIEAAPEFRGFRALTTPAKSGHVAA